MIHNSVKETFTPVLERCSTALDLAHQINVWENRSDVADFSKEPIKDRKKSNKSSRFCLTFVFVLFFPLLITYFYENIKYHQNLLADDI